MIDWMNDWPCGTKKSFGNAFTSHFDGSPTVLTKKDIKTEKLSIAQSMVVARSRTAGRDIGRFQGISHKADELVRQFKEKGKR